MPTHYTYLRTASQRLLAALTREHPEIVQHLTKKGE
jgi:hypothetical protein